MADILSRILGPANIGNGTTTVFTGTGGHVYTFRSGSMKVLNATTGAITFRLGIGGVTNALSITPDILLQPGDMYVHEAVEILTGAETLQALTTATGLTITASVLDQS